jgi:hypothetical protein
MTTLLTITMPFASRKASSVTYPICRMQKTTQYEHSKGNKTEILVEKPMTHLIDASYFAIMGN